MKPQFRRLRCEPLEDRTLLSVAGEEQLFVYLLNRARHDPVAYQREQNLSVDLSAVAPRPPLAVNDALFASTEFHASDMATRNYFSHTTPEGLAPNQMVRDAGYQANALFAPNANYVESIAAGTFTDTASEALNQLIVDAGVSGAGHRVQLLAMNDFFASSREVGVGHAFSAASTYGNYWAVHTVYSDVSDRFLTGVVYADANGNGRYDVNEGLPGVSVSVAGGPSTTTNAAGGWSIEVAGPGTYAVSASGGGFVGTASADVSVGGANVEVDFISGQGSAVVDFATVNHAPTLAPGTFALPATAEDTVSRSVTVRTLLGGAIGDVDAGARLGVAVTGLGGGGTWQYSLDGGLTYRRLTAASESAALVLRDTDRVRFVPAPNFNGTSSLTVRAWDRTAFAAGSVADVTGGTTAFSAEVGAVSVLVTPVNDAPVLRPVVAALTPVAVNDAGGAGDAVAALLATASDADAGAARGVAIVRTVGAGVWQFSADDGGTWNALAAAQRLRETDRVRFVPNAGYTLTTAAAVKPTLRFRAWDQTDGPSSLSVGVGTATVVVNNAPVLAPRAADLGTVSSAGRFRVSVASLLAGSASDVGAGALRGVALTAASSAGGSWQYSTDGGVTFRPMGAVSAAAALLLRPADWLRFVPLPGATGPAALSFRAWDRTLGGVGGRYDLTRPGAVGGQGAFSADEDAATLTVV